MTTTYLSAVCQPGESMLWWINRIIEKGGTPTIQMLSTNP